MGEQTIVVKKPNYTYASGNCFAVLEKVKYLSKIEYEKRVGDNIWLAAWFDGNVKADAKTFFDYEELANEFVTVKKEIRELAMSGRRKSITLLGTSLRQQFSIPQLFTYLRHDHKVLQVLYLPLT